MERMERAKFQFKTKEKKQTQKIKSLSPSGTPVWRLSECAGSGKVRSRNSPKQSALSQALVEGRRGAVASSCAKDGGGREGWDRSGDRGVVSGAQVLPKAVRILLITPKAFLRRITGCKWQLEVD